MGSRLSSAAYIRSLPDVWEVRAKELAKVCHELIGKYEDARLATLRPDDEDDLLEEIEEYRHEISRILRVERVDRYSIR